MASDAAWYAAYASSAAASASSSVANTGVLDASGVGDGAGGVGTHPASSSTSARAANTRMLRR